MHIVIVNAHWNNRGDEAAHRALWEELQKQYPQSKITVMFKDRKPVTWFPESIRAEYFSCQFRASQADIWLTTISRGRLGFNKLLEKAVKTLKTADLIIYPPGGSVINDRFFWSKQMEYLVPFLCAKLYRIPMFVAAPSIGPFDNNKLRPLRKWLLKTPTTICVREAISKHYLETIGIKENVYVTLDLAFMSDIDQEVNQGKLEQDKELNDFLSADQKVVGMTISDFKWHVKFGKEHALRANIEETFKQFINHLSSQGYKVLLIPQLFGNQNDSDYLKTFSDKKNIFVMSDDHDSYFQQFVISKLFAVVGMRYHCNIFAAKVCIPFIAVSYEEKMDGFIQQAGLDEYSLRLEQLVLDDLIEKFALLEREYVKVKKHLNSYNDLWQAKSLRTADFLFDQVREMSW